MAVTEHPTVAPTATKAATKQPRKAPKAVPSAESDVQRVMATGRRKESVARVVLVPGSGTITVNRQPYDAYFSRETLRLSLRQPLLITHQLSTYDVAVDVVGGGTAGQAGAIRLGIARALVHVNPAHRVTLRAAGFLTRDPRMRERKKYGRKGARKRFQWTKR